MSNDKKCPSCLNLFDVTQAKPVFKEQLYQQYILYAFCPDCSEIFNFEKEAERKQRCDQCFINFKLNHMDSNGNAYPWAVTNEITLHVNGYDLTKALINGHCLPRHIYDAVEKGFIDLSVLPTDLYGAEIS